MGVFLIYAIKKTCHRHDHVELERTKDHENWKHRIEEVIFIPSQRREEREV